MITIIEIKFVYDGFSLCYKFSFRNYVTDFAIFVLFVVRFFSDHLLSISSSIVKMMNGRIKKKSKTKENLEIDTY